MSEQHLSEAQIQQYAENEQGAGKELSSHLANCEQCQALLTSYRLLFSLVEESPAPRFDFDLSAAVIEKIAEPYKSLPGERFLYYLGVFFCIAFALAGYYFFSDYLSTMFEGLSKIVSMLALISVLAMLVFLVSDTVRRYHRKIKQLDLY